VYSACGVGESTTDLVFGGHCLVAENGNILAESKRFARDETLTTADVDLDRLRIDRLRGSSFGGAMLYAPGRREVQKVPFAAKATGRFGFQASASPTATELRRVVDAHPFVPSGEEQLRERCEEIFLTQVSGLAKRLEHVGKPPVVIGVSGGLDST